MASDTSFPFTKTSLTNLLPNSKRSWYRDTRTQGLALCVTPAGTKTFYVIRRVAGMGRKGNTEFIRLGTFLGDLTVEQARVAARQKLQLLNVGTSVRASAKTKKDEYTLSDMWDIWLSERAIGPNPDQPLKRSWKKDQRLYDCHLKGRANRRVSEFTPAIVSKIFRDVTVGSGPVEANHVKRLARAMWNHAFKHHDLPGRNPWATLTDNPEASREQWIKPEQMPALLKAVDSISNQDAGDIIRLCLYTGARSGNVKSMRWDQIDTASATWTIGSAHHKNKRVHTIPLAPAAIDILKLRRGVSREWVFPSNSASGHIMSIYDSWTKVIDAYCSEAGFTERPDIRVHDLRHTTASWLVGQGVSLPTIGKLLGHTTTVTTARYAHLATDSVREALEKVTGAMSNRPE